MLIRKIHRLIAIISSPFLIIISLTAFLMILSRMKILNLSLTFDEWIYKTHTWDLIGGYAGLIFPVILLTIVLTGIILFTQIERRKQSAQQKLINKKRS